MYIIVIHRHRALRDKLLKGRQVCFLPGLIPVSVSTETPGTRYRFRASRSANRRISRLSFIFSTWPLSRSRDRRVMRAGSPRQWVHNNIIDRRVVTPAFWHTKTDKKRDSKRK